MRILIQRVTSANVTVEEKIVGEIGTGLLILLGITDDDGEMEVMKVVNKICNLRIFDDEKGVMNRSVGDIDGEILVVSQFTLYADTKKGNRPSYVQAAKPTIAQPIYELFIRKMSERIVKEVQTGVFGADMQVNLTNNGPVTIWIDSKQ